jgi:hypothetical protein
MNWLERWAAGILTVYIAETCPRRRERCCTLLRAARLVCRGFADAGAAVAAMSTDGNGAAVPDILVCDVGNGRRWLRIARARRPDMVIIGLSPLICSGAGMPFSPLRDLLGTDYLLPGPVDAAELLATLALAASEFGSEPAATQPVAAGY